MPVFLSKASIHKRDLVLRIQLSNTGSDTVRVQGSWMWPRAFTAAKRKEVVHHQDMFHAVWNDKLQLWSMGLFASIYPAETCEMLSALCTVWKVLGLSLGLWQWLFGDTSEDRLGQRTRQCRFF